jgi:hypothetical protein
MDNNILAQQVAISHAWSMLYHARIVSGAYKRDKKFHLSNGEHIPLTEEELLKSELDTMERHIRRMSDLTDNMSRTKGE